MLLSQFTVLLLSQLVGYQIGVKEISLVHTQANLIPTLDHTAHHQLKSTNTTDKEIYLMANQT